AAGGDDVGDSAIFEAVENGNIGTPARSQKPTIPEAKDARGGVAGGAIDMVQRAAHGDEAADRAVEVALFGNVERIAVVSAESDEAGGVLVEDFGKGVEVLGDRPFADEYGHALGEFLAGFGGACRFMVGTDACGKIAIERGAKHEGRMAVDMAVLEGQQLCDDARIGIKDAGEIHHFGEADDLGMTAEGQEIVDFELRA